MAILWADSFDHYGTNATSLVNMGAGAWATVPDITYGFVTNAQKRTGNNSMRLRWTQNSSVMMRRVIASNNNEIGVGLGVFLVGLPDNEQYVSFLFMAGSAHGIQFRVTPSGGLKAYGGGPHTSPPLVLLGQTDDGVISPGAFDHIEMRVLRDNIVGEAEVRINGVTVLNLTDLDLGLVNFNSFAFWKAANGSGPESYFDDIVCWDSTGSTNNTFLGPVRVQTLFPNGDTAAAEWSKVGSATGHEAISQPVPDGDTTYIGSNAEGQISEFTLPTLPPETAAIAGVYIPVMGKLEAAGAGSVQVSLVSGADVANGPNIPLTTSYAYWPSVLEVDPATGARWTKAGLEAAKVRVKKTA